MLNTERGNKLEGWQGAEDTAEVKSDSAEERVEEVMM
jgi:hypothetical protein